MPENKTYFYLASIYVTGGAMRRHRVPGDGIHTLVEALPQSCSANRSSRIVTGGKVRAAKHLPRKSHTCSMWIEIRDRAGQSIRSISHSLRAVRQLLCDDMVHCHP
ncbi:hypothetical protein TNCV_2281881 [Trichonephila clavipes]|nr:hypothetical protein TNCV_2281881 [Trichonephila clavipes]